MDLLEAQQFALNGLAAASNGHIDVHVRQILWAELGPPTPSRYVEQGGAMSNAHRARTTLMLECLRTALPEWNEEAARATEPLLGDADSPPTIVRDVDAWLAGALSLDALRDDVRRLDDLTFYYFELHENHPKAELIAHAASSVVWIALYDQASDRGDDYREEENEVFPADFMIAWLRSGQAPWDPDPTGQATQKRAAFWRWYIEDLFPRCWAIAYPEG